MEPDCAEDLGRVSFPVIALEIVEVVALVHAGEAPVETGLVFVMTGAEFGERAFSIRGNDGVEVGRVVGAATWVRMASVWPAVDGDSPAFSSLSRRRLSAATREGAVARRRDERSRVIVF